MADILLPFQGLSDQLAMQGNEFTPQFPPQSLDLPSITISRNLVEQDGVIHSNGLHMVGMVLSLFPLQPCLFRVETFINFYSIYRTKLGTRSLEAGHFCGITLPLELSPT